MWEIPLILTIVGVLVCYFCAHIEDDIISIFLLLPSMAWTLSFGAVFVANFFFCNGASSC